MKKKPTIDEQLRQAVRDCPKTQLEISKAAGIDNGNLSRFMKGRSGMSLESASKLAAYLGLSLKR